VVTVQQLHFVLATLPILKKTYIITSHISILQYDGVSSQYSLILWR